MKYPFIIFYRKDTDSHIDNYFLENQNQLDCTIFFINNKDKMNLLNNTNYQLLITYGEEIELPDINKNRWIHMNELISIEIFNDIVNKKFISICTLERDIVRNIFSIFTTTYNSYNKILR